MATFSDFEPEISAIVADGNEVLSHIVLDYGETLGVVLDKGGVKSKIMLRECFYDTDASGEIIEWHGVLDIRETPWSRTLRRH